MHNQQDGPHDPNPNGTPGRTEANADCRPNGKKRQTV